MLIIPGSGGISGSYVGKQGLYELAGKAMALTDGTFHEEVEEVLASDEHAIVLARHRFTRQGASKDYRTAHVYDIREGKLAQCFEQPRDSARFHDAWGSSQGMLRAGYRWQKHYAGPFPSHRKNLRRGITFPSALCGFGSKDVVSPTSLPAPI
jgi:ketosteroid isomerase-like protein